MNAVERGVILCRGDYVSEMDFPLSVSDVPAPEREVIREGLKLRDDSASPGELFIRS
jgi:hypothetical protein